MSAADLFDWAASQVRYPARVHDPVTSYESAEAIGQHVTSLEAMVLEALETHGGQTSEQLAARLGISLVTVSPRLRPLEKKGKVRRAGTRPNSSRRNATVWEAV